MSCSHPEEREEKSRKFHHTKIAPSKKKTCRSDSNGSEKNPSINITCSSNGSGFALSNRSSDEIWHGVSRSKRRVSATPSVNMITEEGDDQPGSVIVEEGGDDDELSKSSASAGSPRLSVVAASEALESNRRTSLDVASECNRRTSLAVGS